MSASRHLLRRRRASRAALFAATLALVPAARPSPARAEDRQPVPPRVFFASPDDITAAEITQLIETSFADVNKAPLAREALVRRFGLWAVPPLLDAIKRDANAAIVWNSILTVGSLRRALGPSQHLWPAIRVLSRVLRGGGESYRRVFAALALGEFYGPDLARIGPASREGTAEGAQRAREDLADGQAALAERMLDADPTLQTAATLALGKIGGMDAWSRLASFVDGSPSLAHWQPRVARLLASGLLPGSDRGALVAASRDADTRLRAGAALGAALWATGQVHGEGAELPATAITRAGELDAAFDRVRNTVLRDGDDGAEAIYARGALAHVQPVRTDVWNTIWLAATLPGAEGPVAIAATQALLFAPLQSAVRRQMAELIVRPRSGLQREDSVVAGFLMVSGSDGTPLGVRACREFLSNRARDPRGRAEWDARFHAVLGLCRALEAGRIARADRADALEALADAARTLVAGEIGARTFKSVFDEVLGRSVLAQLAADADQRLGEGARQRLQSAFVDPDVMTASDPIDVVLDRLNDQVWLLFGLDGVRRAASGGGRAGRASRAPTTSRSAS